MNTTKAHNNPLLLANVSHLSFSALFGRVYVTLLRQRSRKSLAALDASQLADIGVNREQALSEAGKAFWSH